MEKSALICENNRACGSHRYDGENIAGGDHIGCPLVVVLGHTHCGAVDAAIHHSPDVHIKYITDEILTAIGTETDDYTACCLNVKHSVKVIDNNLDMQKLEQERGVKVCGAVYCIDSGWVEFLDSVSN